MFGIFKRKRSKRMEEVSDSAEIVNNTISCKLLSMRLGAAWKWVDVPEDFFVAGGVALIEVIAGEVARGVEVHLESLNGEPHSIELKEVIEVKAVSSVSNDEPNSSDKNFVLSTWFGINICAIEEVVSELSANGERVMYIGANGEVYAATKGPKKVLAKLPAMPTTSCWPALVEMFEDRGLVARQVEESEGSLLVVSWEIDQLLKCA